MLNFIHLEHFNSCLIKYGPLYLSTCDPIPYISLGLEQSKCE